MVGYASRDTCLGAEMEVAEQNCSFRTGDDQDQKHEEQKAEHVVHLIGPAKDNPFAS